MATTPRPYIWKEAQLINNTADETGASFHFYDTAAEVIYPDDGLKYKSGYVPDGHWEDLELSEEEELESTDYLFLKGDHPATGSLYMIGLRRTSSHDTLYLFRYDYERDVSELVEEMNVVMQSDNPIAQVSGNIKNIQDSLFTKVSSLFVPSSKLTLGVAYGKSMINTLLTGYLDEVNWRYGRATISLTGRNTVGYALNSQSFDQNISFSGTAIEVLIDIFETFGITKYEIDPLGTQQVAFDVSATDTGMKALQIISDLLSDVLQDKFWDIEELYDGTIICGFEEFRSDYLPKGNYVFHGKNDVFSNSISRSIDGSYSHVVCTGTDKSGNDLTPVKKEVITWKYWTPGEHRTYHAPRVDGITQSELEKYATILAKQLKEGGQIVKYQSTLRPQLLIGDVAQLESEDPEEENKTLGIVTEIRHNLGVRGFTTEFTAASGGEIKTIGNKTYTKSKGVNGSNRSRRISDYITNPNTTETNTLNVKPTPQPLLRYRLWAEMDGSDYIRLPYILQEEYQVYVDYELDQTAMLGSNPNVGIIGTASGDDYNCLIALRSGYYHTSTGTSGTEFLGATYGRHRVIINSDFNGTYGSILFGDEEVSRYWPVTLATYGMMFLGRCPGADAYFTGKIYRYKIIDNNTEELIMDLRPADYISSDGVTLNAGLYDTVGKQFYECEGMSVHGYA